MVSATESRTEDDCWGEGTSFILAIQAIAAKTITVEWQLIGSDGMTELSTKRANAGCRRRMLAREGKVDDGK